MHPEDERALKLTQAFRHFELDPILGLIGDTLQRPRDQARSNLLPIFEHAQHDDLDLLHPPAHFHTWLHTPLLQARRRAGQVRPNTVITRLSTLIALYDRLIDEGVLTENPARGYPAPSAEHKDAPLPTPSDIQRLLAEARGQDHELFAALTLMYRHAFQLKELLALRWSALDFSRGELLRARTVSPLSPEAMQALQPLLAQAGGPLHASEQAERVLTYAGPDDIRLKMWRTCKNANLPHISPSELRKAALRDHPPAREGTGYSSPQAHRRALKYAQQVAEKAQV